MVLICTWLLPTETGDNSDRCAGLAGHNSSDCGVVSGIEAEKLMSCLSRGKGE